MGHEVGSEKGYAVRLHSCAFIAIRERETARGLTWGMDAFARSGKVRSSAVLSHARSVHMMVESIVIGQVYSHKLTDPRALR